MSDPSISEYRLITRDELLDIDGTSDDEIIFNAAHARTIPDNCPEECIYKRFAANMRNAEARDSQMREEGAKAERKWVLKETCRQCPVREEIQTDDPRCAESCEGCLVRMVCGEPLRSSSPSEDK